MHSLQCLLVDAVRLTGNVTISEIYGDTATYTESLANESSDDFSETAQAVSEQVSQIRVRKIDQHTDGLSDTLKC